MTRLAAVVSALAVALAAAGCGLGAGEAQEGDGATLRVTRDFGAQLLHGAEREAVREGDTVMRFLQEAVDDVDTGYGGRFVSGIDGLRMDEGPPPRDWFYWVNGIEASVGAAEYELHPGDVVHWDYRRWDAAMRIPAIVGAFPEPFLHGIGGERVPVRVECAEPEGPACETAKDKLGEAGVAAPSSVIGTSSRPDVLRVLVAPWSRMRALNSARVLTEGPGVSGVFARFSDDGRLQLLGPDGEPVRTAPAGSGLVAAVAYAKTKAVWLVTGVDEAGTERAAGALDAATLRDAFAVAVLPEGPVKLPVADAGEE
jgi:hypothetical protein